jgi:hypothetical protein
MHGPLNVKEAETGLLRPNSWRMMMIMKHACHFRIIRTRSLKVFLTVKLFFPQMKEVSGEEVWLHSCLTSALDVCGHFHSSTALRSVSI